MAQLLTVYEGKQTNETINFTMIECYKCGVPFMVPERLRQNWLKSKDEFFCPNGHGQIYTKSTAQILEEKMERQKQLHERELEVIQNRLLDEVNLRQDEEKKRKKSDRLLKRVHNGVCPCCNRSFVNLQRHMKTKHPELNSLKGKQQ